MKTVAQWAVFEESWTTSRVHDDPVREVALTVEFIAPSGRTETVSGFWDGGKCWRVRHCPDELGAWNYRTRCEQDSALDGHTGSFECIPDSSDNPLYRHGDVRRSEDRHYLVHADGTPYFWLGDTAWNGVLLSDAQAWDAYLGYRAQQGFTGVQFVLVQWRSADVDAEGRAAFSGHRRIRLNPRFFQRADARIAAINAHGLIAAPVMIWALGESPGVYLPEDQQLLLAQYIRARYEAFQVIWILGGDGNYRGERAEPWRRIGRAVFGESPRRLVTMHPGGLNWVANEFRLEPWFGFNCYQSGHGDSADHLRWLCQGPPAQAWNEEPILPHLNFEPNYEGHLSYHSKKRFDAHDVRRAAYWSLLVGVPAGVSYGAQGIWGWHLEERLPPDHLGTGSGPAWYEAVHFPGARSMSHLRRFFDGIEWWRLRPAQGLLREQPGAEDPGRYVVAAASETGDLAVLYTPEAARLSLDLGRLQAPFLVRWYNPARGETVRQETYPSADGAAVLEVAGEMVLLFQSVAR